MVNEQPEALRLADELEDSLYSADGTSLSPYGQGIADEAAAELRRLHEVEKQRDELLAALRVAALAIHEYRTQGAPHAYWDDVEYQAAEAIAKAERTTT